MHFGNDSRWWAIEKRECFFKISFLRKLSLKELLYYLGIRVEK